MVERLVILGMGVAAALVVVWVVALVAAATLADAATAVTAPIRCRRVWRVGSRRCSTSRPRSAPNAGLQQTPILAQLQNKVDVAVHKLDAIEQEALARFYGIMTVPTTVVLDQRLQPVAINHGVAPLQKLQAQVRGIVR
jgi:hypothetical protein